MGVEVLWTAKEASNFTLEDSPAKTSMIDRKRKTPEPYVWCQRQDDTVHSEPQSLLCLTEAGIWDTEEPHGC